MGSALPKRGAEPSLVEPKSLAAFLTKPDRIEGPNLTSRRA